MNREFSLPLRVSDVMFSLLKHSTLILLLTFVGFCAGGILTIMPSPGGEISKDYAITTSIAVTSVTEDGMFTTRSISPNSADIYLAERMVDSVIYVLKSDKLVNSAIKNLEISGISNSDIIDNLTLKQYNATQIIEMTLYWHNAEEGVQILSAMNSAAPDVLIETLKIGGVSVVNEPTVKQRSSINVSVWVCLASLGFMVGVGISLLQLLWNPTLMRPRDIERCFGLKVLGEIPEDKRNSRVERAGQMHESFAAAAHILHNSLSNQPNRILYITSSVRNEGRTSVAANLAVCLSDLEQKVLLVDCDVRNPGLGAYFLGEVSFHNSLNALHRGETTVDQAITKLSDYLDLLPAVSENRELSLDDSMLELLKSLAEKYDYVLMDTGPIGRVSDPMNLNRICKNALFVARFDLASMSDIREAAERLEKSGIATVGCIVNGVRKLGRQKEIR